MSISTKNDELMVAGIRLQITGEAQFVQTLQTSAKQSGLLKNELKLLEAGMTAAGKKGSDYLRAKSESLTSAISAQEERTRALKNALAAASAEGKTDANVTADLEKNILANQIATAKLTASLKETNTALARSENVALAAGIAQKEMGEKAETAGKKVSGVGDSLTKCVTAPALAAAAALAALVAKTVETADGIQKTADVTGLSTDRIQELTYAGKDLDVELEVMTKSMAKNIKSMKSAQDGTALTVDAYKKLGVEYKNSDGSLKDSETVYWEVINSLSSMTNETERDAIAMQLLGKSAQELNPLIKAGKDKLAELSEEAHKNGAVMSGESVAALDAFGDSIEKAKVSIGTAAGEITVKMMPTLNKLLPIVQDEIVPAIGEFAEMTGNLIVGFNELDPAAKSVITSVAGIILVAGPAITMVGKGITLYGTLNAALGAHKIAAAASAAATTELAASEGAATVAGTGLAATLGPILLIAAAVAATGIAYTAITAESKALTDAVLSVTDAMNASNEAFDQTITDTNTSAAATKTMADKLYALEGIEVKSNAQKAQMKTLVASLNSAVPDLSLSYDAQTDSLSKNKDAVYDLIDAKMAQLKMTAYEQQITKLYEEQIEQAELYAAAVERYNKAEADMTYTINPVSTVKKVTEFNNAYDALIAVIDASDKTTASLATSEQAYADLSTAAGKTADSLDKSSAEIVTVSQETRDEIKAIYDARMEDVLQYNADMEQSTKDHYDEMGALDDDGITKTELTAAEIKANLEQQIADYSNWRASIKELASRVPSDVLEELKKLGPEMGPVIDELNSMTDEELASWLAVWDAKGTLAETAAKEDAAAIAAALGSGVNGATLAGENTIQGFITGMQNKEQKMLQTAKRLAEGIPLKFNYTLDVHSPSRVMIKSGENTGEGAIIGLKNKQKALEDQAAKMGAGIIDGMSVVPAVSLGTVATNKAMSGYALSSSSVVNNSTTNAPSINIAVNNPTVRSQQDIDGITKGIALKVTETMKAMGAI